MKPTKKKIAIVGAGQAGLQLAMSLLDKPGYTDPVAFARWMKDKETADAHVQMRLEEVAAKQVVPEVSEPPIREDEVSATRFMHAVATIR